MDRDGMIIEIQSREEAEYVAIAVSQVNNGHSLQNSLEIMDIYAASKLKDEEFRAIILSEEASSLVFKAIRARAEAPGKLEEDATRRLVAVDYLRQLDLLGVKTLAAAE